MCHTVYMYTTVQTAASLADLARLMDSVLALVTSESGPQH